MYLATHNNRCNKYSTRQQNTHIKINLLGRHIAERPIQLFFCFAVTAVILKFKLFFYMNVRGELEHNFYNVLLYVLFT